MNAGAKLHLVTLISVTLVKGQIGAPGHVRNAQQAIRYHPKAELEQIRQCLSIAGGT
jgi:hypothetical protein